MDLFPGHPAIETEHFRLRAIRRIETDLMHTLGLAFWGGKPAASLEIGRESVAKTAVEFIAGRCLHWVVESKHDASIVGCVGFYRGFENSQGEVGYVITAEARGRGIMTEVLPRLLDYGFREKKLQKIIAVTQAENLPSVALLAHFGFIYESERADGYRQYGRSSLPSVL
jgi:ribosomal-protein-alanine N-acetyltransferase